MTHTRVARRYASALMQASEQSQAREAIAQDLQMIAATLRDSRELRLLVASPIVRAPKKAGVFKALFASRVHPHTMAFIGLLIAKQREGILQETIVQYMNLRDLELSIVNIGIVSAVELTGQQQDALQRQLERYTGKKVRMHLSIDRANQRGHCCPHRRHRAGCKHPTPAGDPGRTVRAWRDWLRFVHGMNESGLRFRRRTARIRNS